MSQVSAAMFLRVIRETSRFMLSTPKRPRPLWKAHHQGPTTTVRRSGVVTAPSAWRRSLARVATPKRG